MGGDVHEGVLEAKTSVRRRKGNTAKRDEEGQVDDIPVDDWTSAP